jgi:hypothetical protein
MDLRSTQQRFRIAAATLGLLGWVGASFAAPPANSAVPSHERPHLDLTPPALDAFKNALDLQAKRPHALGTETRSGLSLDADAWQDKPSARMSDLVRRVHREGLPVARLWENRSALLSLGLNQRGKPGLWIIQKTQ